jgi:hypothetical protein
MRVRVGEITSFFVQPDRNALGNAAGVVLLALFSLLLVGCGLTINSPGNQSTGTSSGGSGSSGGNGGQTIPIPATIQPFTGCENPNTGVSNGDWGVGSNPVFVNPWSVQVGQPVYTSNTIFWTSRETKPGQSILLTGAFTDATKTARIAFIPPGTTDWETLVKNSATVVSTIEQSSTGLSFIVPSEFPVGVYGFQIEEPTLGPNGEKLKAAPSILGLANQPALNWAVGVPPQTALNAPLTHQVYDCGVEPGGILRIFGKNFLASNQVILQTSDGTAYTLPPSTLDSNSIAVPIPSGFAPGTYNVWVGTSPWSATSSPAAQITIYSPPSFKVLDVSCSTLIGDGVTDNTKRVQLCLDWYAPPPGIHELAYISLPPGGPFVLTGGVTGSPFEVLVGPASGTSFVGRPSGAPPAAWFSIPQYFGMVNISLKAPANPSLLTNSGTSFSNPLTSGHMFFNNVNFASTDDAFNPSEFMFAVAGPDIQVYNSTFVAYANQDFDISYGDGAVLSGNHFVLNNWTGLGIFDSQNVIFEKNLTDSAQPLGPGNYGTSGGSGLSIGRANNVWGPSALSRDIYVGYNGFQNMGSNTQQVVLNDGDGGAYYGPIASSTADTVTLAADPWWAWMGTTNPEAASMAIVSGTGVGQYSFLESYRGRTITLAQPWKVLPDATSVVVISQYELYMTWAHNTITNTDGATFVLADALESVIEDNPLTNSGMGILISAFGPYGGPASYGPVMNTDVLRNTLSVGEGTDIWLDTNNSGIGIQDMPGCLVSGLMIRDNVVPVIQTIYDTDGVAGMSAVLVEQNQAYWSPTSFPSPGLLIQDNSPAPPNDSTPGVRRLPGNSALFFAARSSRLYQMAGP